MKINLPVVAVTAVVTLSLAAGFSIVPHIDNTAERIAEHNFPVEKHEVITEDGYILTMFRIPYSPKCKNKYKPRPAVYLQHGFTASSDSWLLSGPDNALPFVLATAGYDVWLGNSRGNTYSKRNLCIPSFLAAFWDFSFHDVGVYDITAMIDYILDYKNENTLHYVGHSLGTAAFLAAMSIRPSYNAKMKTVHLLAPICFLKHSTSLVFQIGTQLLGHPSFLADSLGDSEILANNIFRDLIGSEICAPTSPAQHLCAEFLFSAFGYDYEHFNLSVIPDWFEIHPAGASAKQLIHLLQLVITGEFQQFDYTEKVNIEVYHNSRPPSYPLNKITSPVRLYGSENDLYSNVTDVKNLASKLPNLTDFVMMPFPQWNHIDFLYALEVKAVLNDKIVEVLNYFEKTGKQLIHGSGTHSFTKY